MKKQSGNHSSKYALNPEQLEKDLLQKELERNTFISQRKEGIISE